MACSTAVAVAIQPTNDQDRVLGAVCWPLLACAHLAGACQLKLTAGRKPSTFIASAKLRATPRRMVLSRSPSLELLATTCDANLN